MGVGNFAEFGGSGPKPRTILKAILATSLTKRISPQVPLNLQPGRQLQANVGDRSELLAALELSRAIVGEVGGAQFGTTTTGHVWVLNTVTSAVAVALKLVECTFVSDAFALRIGVDLGDVYENAENAENAGGGRGEVFERVLTQVQSWPGSGIACSLAAATAVGTGSNVDFRTGPVPDTLTPFLS